MATALDDDDVDAEWVRAAVCLHYWRRRTFVQTRRADGPTDDDARASGHGAEIDDDDGEAQKGDAG